MEGMKREQCLTLRMMFHVGSLASNHLLCRAPKILLLFHRAFTKDLRIMNYKIIGFLNDVLFMDRSMISAHQNAFVILYCPFATIVIFRSSLVSLGLLYTPH